MTIQTRQDLLGQIFDFVSQAITGHSELELVFHKVCLQWHLYGSPQVDLKM